MGTTCGGWQRLGTVTWQLWRRSEHCNSRLNAQGWQWYEWTRNDLWSLNICVITSSDEVGKMVRKIRTRAIVDALVVNGMKNKLVVDSETKRTNGRSCRLRRSSTTSKTKTSRSSTWILVDDANTKNKLEYHDRSYTCFLFHYDRIWGPVRIRRTN